MPKQKDGGKMIKDWDTAEHLDNEEVITAYLQAAFEDGDPDLIVEALGNIARARSMTQLAKDAGISRSGLYKALTPSNNPSFAQIMKIMKALGVSIEPVFASSQDTAPITA